MEYYDLKSETCLETYADTVVIETIGDASYIAAIRFGGYTESVRGMGEAINGGGTVTIYIDETITTLYTYVKQYRKEFTHDGIYAEATLIIRDEEQRADCREDNPVNRPRKCYLFCEKGDSDRLFEELDKKIAVPLIPDFKNYILSELQDRGYLESLRVISSSENFDAWILKLASEEKNIIEVVEDGLKSGNISIPGSADTKFPEVASVTQYLNTFGVLIAERIKKQFQPLFDPSVETLSPEILGINTHIKETAGYSLYDAQLAVAEAHKRCLEKRKSTLCIAECGSGKTKIGITALHAYQQRKAAKHFNVVICPSHMTKKWVREIEETLPNTFATTVNNISELNTVYSAYENDAKTYYVVMSKEKARDGYMKRPSAIWNERRKVFICPTCYKTVEMLITNDGSIYKIPANALFFKRENKQNHKCAECDSLLWTAIVPGQRSEWVKASNFGFVHRKLADQYLDSVKKKPALHATIQEIADNPEGAFTNAGAYRRFSLSTYIKNRMRGKIDGLVIESTHR